MSKQTSTITGRLWIAREANGKLWVFDAEPDAYEDGFVQANVGDLSDRLPDHFYPELLPGQVKELN